jgi:CrcB protein
MLSTLLVGLGSAIGGMARYGCSLFLARLLGETFPWGTLFVNVTGSFIIGLFFTLTASGGRLLISPDWRIFVTVGLCGGYTTFSSFSLQTLSLLRDGEWLQGGLNAIGSFVLCLGAVWLGSISAAALNHRP